MKNFTGLTTKIKVSQSHSGNARGYILHSIELIHPDEEKTIILWSSKSSDSQEAKRKLEVLSKKLDKPII